MTIKNHTANVYKHCFKLNKVLGPEQKITHIWCRALSVYMYTWLCIKYKILIWKYYSKTL